MNLTGPERMFRFKRLAKEGSWIVAGQIAFAAASLVLVRVLTEYLDPTQYGQLALALTLGTLICQVAFSGSLPGIMRYFSIAVDKGEINEYFQASLHMMGYGILVALALSTLMLIGLPFFGKKDLLGLVCLTIVFSIFGVFNTAQSMIQNAARQRKIVALHGSIDAWLKVAFAAGLLAWLGNSAKVVVIAYISSLILVLISQAFFIRRLSTQKEISSENSKFWAKQIWQYSKPFVYFNAFTWVQASADRWALESYTTSQEVGLYAVLLQLGFTPMGMIAGLMTTLMGPIFFQQSGDTTDASRNSKVHKQTWQITSIAIAFTLLVFLFAQLFHEWIFNLFVAVQFRTVSYLLPWMILAGGLFAAGQMLSLKLMSDLNTQALVWPKIITSLLGAALSFSGAYFAGLIGVVIAAVVFSVLQLLWIGWLSRPPFIHR